MEKIIQFVEVVKDLPWKKIIAIAVAIAVVTLSIAFISSCALGRRTVTYGTVKSEYVKYDTIKSNQSGRIPKSYHYVEP